jgi:hypothetical protein
VTIERAIIVLTKNKWMISNILIGSLGVGLYLFGLPACGEVAQAVKPVALLARGGDWTAYRDNDLLPPDGCGIVGWASNGPSIGLNATGRTFELTLGYNYPALTGKIIETLTVSVDDTQRLMPVTSMSNFTIFVSLNRTDAVSLVHLLGGKGVMTVNSNKTVFAGIPLSNIAPALNSFITCANLAHR